MEDRRLKKAEYFNEEQREEEGEEEENPNDDDNEENQNEEEASIVKGAYDPNEFDNINVSNEIKNILSYITCYSPQTIDLEMKLKPFIPDYIPAVGDIDTFVKIPRPDDVDDGLGLTVLDEPSSKYQSDPTLLNLRFKAISKEIATDQADNTMIKIASSSKEIDNWIVEIKKLHEETASISSTLPLLHSQRLPDIEQLMQEWDPDFEKALLQYQLPTSDLDVTLDEYVTIICNFLDIPVHQSKIVSLHIFFNLYHEFQNSQHFKKI